MRRTVSTIIASSLAVISIAVLAFFFYGRATPVRVAVTEGSIDHQIMMTAAKILQRERSSIRFRMLVKPDQVAAARALETGNADIAIVRSDLGLPLNGKAVVIMRNSSALLMAPPKSRLSSIAELRGKRIGIVTGGHFGKLNTGLLKTILNQYDVAADSVTLIPVEPAQIQAALQAGKLDAVFTIGEASVGPVSEIVNLVAGNSHDEPLFLSIKQAPAIAQTSPALSSTKIVAGVFGGPKPRPHAALDSVAVTTLLMADAKLDDSMVSAIARAIFSLKPKIASTIPTALRMEAPSTNKDAALAVHPGAAAYLNGEDISLLTRYSDFIYLGAMVLSMIGSAIAAVVSRANSGCRRRLDELLNRLLELLSQIRLADNASMLKLAQIEVDSILAEALSTGGKPMETDMVSALGLAIGQVREAIRDKHAELAAGAREVRPGGIQSSKASPRALRASQSRSRAAS